MVALLNNFMGPMSHVGSSNRSVELNYVPSLISEPTIQMTIGENINMGPPLPSQDFIELPHVESPMHDTMIPFPLPPEVQLDDEARSSESFHSQSSEDGGDILSIPMDDDSPDDGDCDTHLNHGEIPPYNERVMHFMNDIGEENDDDNVDREDNVHIDIWSESKNQIRLGMLFDSKSQLRKAVTLWSISQNREFKVVESRINTWVAKCKVVPSDIDSNSGPENYRSSCLWCIRAVHKKTHKMWQITRWVNMHNCLGSISGNNNRNLTSAIIVSHIIHQIEVNPRYPVKNVQVDIKQSLHVDVSYKKACHGRRKTIEIVYGNWESNFAELPLYIVALEHSNPNTIVKWHHHPSSTENVKVFKYIFWAFGPAIDAFHMSRPVISVDGTHLQGACKGKMLIAISKDANNRILPVAYDIVDEETMASWCWFFEQFSTTQRWKFNRFKRQIRALDPAAWQYLRDIDIRRWSLAYDGNHRWGCLTTNTSESFNNVLRGARLLPIKACIDLSFHRTVQLFQRYKQVAHHCNTALPPHHWSKFMEAERHAQGHHIDEFNYTDGVYKIVTTRQLNGKGGHVHTVFYYEKDCTCGKCQMHRFPCSHAIAVCRHKGDNAIDLVDEVHTTKTYMAQYSGKFYPIHHKDYWTNPVSYPFQFIWLPYEEHVLELLPSYCTRGRVCWRSVTYLICWEIVEAHLPNRVLQQFGMHQPIPIPRLLDKHVALHKMTRSGRANTNWIETHQQYIDHWRDSLNHVENGELVNDPMHASVEYMSWYWQRTVIYITNPSQRFSSSGFQGDGETTEYLMDGMCRLFYTSLDLMAISDAKHAGYFAQIRDIASHYMHQARGQQRLDIRHSHTPTVCPSPITPIQLFDQTLDSGITNDNAHNGGSSQLQVNDNELDEQNDITVEHHGDLPIALRKQKRTVKHIGCGLLVEYGFRVMNLKYVQLLIVDIINLVSNIDEAEEFLKVVEAQMLLCDTFVGGIGCYLAFGGFLFVSSDLVANSNAFAFSKCEINALNYCFRS
ncbi:hypothetical protein ZIOFF_072668 [Zingiber officinale]|uniref:SWIM-type domain-containing protein n=1 Tax=Zingiber officinale TaxID=94328 RepID=A0A8J5C668_ZINOF|nr:hypothetical protein ZIOFF_072668 [Zingiber officinale]